MVRRVGSVMKTLQEKLDAVALELEPVLWELLNEIEENK
jgi:hypothetical protein